MRTYPMVHTDAFTDVLFGGNPTATILEADSLSEQEMKKIAIEMNHSETAFILKSRLGDLRLRYFTRTGDEIDFCGHATVGAMIAYVHQEGEMSEGPSAFVLETNRGLLKIWVEGNTVEMELPEVELVPISITHDELEEAFGFPVLDKSRPLMMDKNNNYLYAAAASFSQLQDLKPDFAGLRAFCEKYKLIIVCLSYPEVFDKESSLHSRGFAPWVGVPEDPFTGSMQGGAYLYAKKQGWIGEKTEIAVEQGHIMGRPGKAIVKVADPRKMYLKASGKRFFKTTITLE
ncbi:PhzF family phenazine biosynthesis protein [Estrella lausannensis]|uniref:PhzF family phenazine biosynthesis protein n=1 Tax=Estrella lausannensis TaxID=483423 RepID=A0A0H5DUC1_9BACT|nr:PhzF family phenazine biosynthesis protein [Estrella lausannensis]CRX39529.1 hypothetical protein ELAC_2209 [Estrella lausannensis]